MARTKRESGRWSNEMGQLVGRALGEGLAKGLQGSMEKLRAELAPLGTELAAMLLREAELAAAEAIPSTDEELGRRRCSEPGCIRRAIARGMCRRHYARQTYREKKDRLSAESQTPPRPRGRPRVKPVEPSAKEALKPEVLKPEVLPKKPALLVPKDPPGLVTPLESVNLESLGQEIKVQRLPAREAKTERAVDKPVEKRIVAPVPPMVRKKDSQPAPGSEVESPVAAEGFKPALSGTKPSSAEGKAPGEAPDEVLDSVAKFFGQK